MKIKKIVIGAGLVIIGLPLVVVLITIVSISVLDRTSGSIVSFGRTREYLLHVPNSYDPAKPTPLVISMHGGAVWPAHQMNLSHWNRLADENGFIVVYPAGSRVLSQFTRTPKMWETFAEFEGGKSEDRGTGLERDVRFISELIDTLRSAYNIDPARIYANGMSNGGGMAFVLSCTLSDRIAAIGMVAPAQSLPSSWCTDTRPVPMIAFYGDADPVVPYDGGPLNDPFNPTPPVFPAARDFVASWAQRNRCTASPVESTIAPDVARIEYPDCAEGADVLLYTIQGGGHTWPGGKPMPEWYLGPTSNSITATRLMWAFFREHRLPRNE